MQFAHNGHTVTVDAETFLFHVAGPQFEAGERRYFPSALSAKEEIDKRVKAAEREAITIRRVALPAIDGNGEPITIRGINRATSSILGATNAEGMLQDFFPAVSWIAALLKERRMVRARMKAIEKIVEKFGMRAKAGYAVRLDATQYDRALAAFEAEFDRKAQAALTAPEAAAKP